MCVFPLCLACVLSNSSIIVMALVVVCIILHSIMVPINIPNRVYEDLLSSLSAPTDDQRRARCDIPIVRTLGNGEPCDKCVCMPLRSMRWQHSAELAGGYQISLRWYMFARMLASSLLWSRGDCAIFSSYKFCILHFSIQNERSKAVTSARRLIHEAFRGEVGIA